jgi:soluble lytic murein transglycosylase-like protein
MPVARIMLILASTVALPLPLGPSHLGASGRGLEGDDGIRSAAPSGATAPASMESKLAVLARRLESVEADATRVDDLVAIEVTPLIEVLAGLSPDRNLVTRVAVALVREGRRSGIDPRLLLAVLIVENDRLDPEARSIVGAIGLMQVMPFHAGGWGCVGDDLTDPEVNICHGAQILAHELRRSPDDVDRALLRYNGCVRGTNTPNCHLYPSRVRTVRTKL